MRDRFVAMMAGCFPRYAVHSGFFATLLTMMTTFHGIALYRSVHMNEVGESMREQWLLSALRGELEAIRAQGGDADNPLYRLPF